MKTIPVSPILAGLLLCSAASGQEAESRPERAPESPRREAGHPMATAWRNADADHDGFLTMEEFSRFGRVESLPDDKKERLFKRLDKNGDGKIGRRELSDNARNRGGGKRPLPRLWELDADKSGGVSYEEFSAGKPFAQLEEKRRRKVFERLDTNKDGEISPADRPERPRGRDGKGFGKRPAGDAADARRNPRVWFKTLDLDGDGEVSFEEFRKGPQVRDLSEDEQEDKFMDLDRNDDLKLTADDFRREPEAPPAGE